MVPKFECTDHVPLPIKKGNNPIDKNDLTQALEIIQRYKRYIMDGHDFEETDNAHSVIKTKIAESGDYNLSGDMYKVNILSYNKSYKLIKLCEVVEILDNLRKPIKKSDRNPGPYPYYGATGILDYVDDYIFNERLILVGEDGAKWSAGERTAFIAEGKYWVNNHAHVLRPIKDKIIDTYLLEILCNLDLNKYITGVTVPKLNQEKLKSIVFPLPPLEVQREIVAEIDSYQKIIYANKKLISMYEQKIKDKIAEVWGK